MRHLAAIVLLALCAGRPLHAQWQVEAGLAGAREIVQLRGASPVRLTGAVLGGEAVVMRGHFSARLRYGQGRVSNDSAARDVAEGEALLGYRALPWLSVWVGPQARTFVTPGLSDRRWLFWSGRVRARGGIFPGRLYSFAELWQGFSGRLNRPASSASGGGAELGLEARLGRRPFSGRLAYRIEQGRAEGGLRETVEGFTLTLAYTPRP
jgi:hypothetical protein